MRCVLISTYLSLHISRCQASYSHQALPNFSNTITHHVYHNNSSPPNPPPLPHFLSRLNRLVSRPRHPNPRRLRHTSTNYGKTHRALPVPVRHECRDGVDRADAHYDAAGVQSTSNPAVGCCWGGLVEREVKRVWQAYRTAVVHSLWPRTRHIHPAAANACTRHGTRHCLIVRNRRKHCPPYPYDHLEYNLSRHRTLPTRSWGRCACFSRTSVDQ
jgi:hypothetical protein